MRLMLGDAGAAEEINAGGDRIVKTGPGMWAMITWWWRAGRSMITTS